MNLLYSGASSSHHYLLMKVDKLFPTDNLELQVNFQRHHTTQQKTPDETVSGTKLNEFAK